MPGSFGSTSATPSNTMAPPGTPVAMAVSSGVAFQPDPDRSCRVAVICSLNAVLSTAMTAKLEYATSQSGPWIKVNSASTAITLLAVGTSEVTVDYFVRKGHWLRCTVTAYGLGAVTSLSAVKQTF